VVSDLIILNVWSHVPGTAISNLVQGGGSRLLGLNCEHFLRARCLELT
jgi:hypothetical protein